MVTLFFLSCFGVFDIFRGSIVLMAVFSRTSADVRGLGFGTVVFGTAFPKFIAGKPDDPVAARSTVGSACAGLDKPREL